MVATASGARFPAPISGPGALRSSTSTQHAMPLPRPLQAVPPQFYDSYTSAGGPHCAGAIIPHDLRGPVPPVTSPAHNVPSPLARYPSPPPSAGWEAPSGLPMFPAMARHAPQHFICPPERPASPFPSNRQPAPLSPASSSSSRRRSESFSSVGSGDSGDSGKSSRSVRFFEIVEVRSRSATGGGLLLFPMIYFEFHTNGSLFVRLAFRSTRFSHLAPPDTVPSDAAIFWRQPIHCCACRFPFTPPPDPFLYPSNESSLHRQVRYTYHAQDYDRTSLPMAELTRDDVIDLIRYRHEMRKSHLQPQLQQPLPPREPRAVYPSPPISPRTTLDSSPDCTDEGGDAQLYDEAPGPGACSFGMQ